MQSLFSLLRTFVASTKGSGTAGRERLLCTVRELPTLVTTRKALRESSSRYGYKESSRVLVVYTESVPVFLIVPKTRLLMLAMEPASSYNCGLGTYKALREEAWESGPKV